MIIIVSWRRITKRKEYNEVKMMMKTRGKLRRREGDMKTKTKRNKENKKERKERERRRKETFTYVDFLCKQETSNFLVHPIGISFCIHLFIIYASVLYLTVFLIIGYRGMLI